MFPDLPDLITCDWRDPESVEDLLDALEGMDSRYYGVLWDDERQTYDIEPYL